MLTNDTLLFLDNKGKYLFTHRTSFAVAHAAAVAAHSLVALQALAGILWNMVPVNYFKVLLWH